MGARTLLALTVAPPRRPARGSACLQADGTFMDRIAGLIDPGRNSMTTASFLTRAALGTALVTAGLIAVSVRVSTAAQAGQQKVAAAKPATASQIAANSEIWDVEGVVVDEQDRPVAGATVRTMPVFDGPANVAVKTGVDGTFRFALRPSSMRLVFMAEADGARMGLDSLFDRQRVERIKSPRIVLSAEQICNGYG